MGWNNRVDVSRYKALRVLKDAEVWDEVIVPTFSDIGTDDKDDDGTAIVPNGTKSVFCRFSRSLLVSSNPGIDTVLTQDMATALSEALDAVSPDAMNRLRTEFVQNAADATDGQPIMSAQAGLLGYPVVVSSVMPAKTILLARWADVIACTWSSGLDTVIDPYTDARAGNIRLISELFVDFGVRHPESLVKITLT